ncbi:MAG: glycosyltransferase [Nitrososphaerota archaeon]
MSQRRLGAMERLAIGLSVASIADRLMKLGLVSHYFSRRRQLAEPASWPSVTILQPITRGVAALRANLDARARLDYPARVQHILLCDASDTDSLAICADAAAAHPELDMRVVRIAASDEAERGRATVQSATKLVKLQAGLPYAMGDVLCLMDDDVAPRPYGLRRLVTYLMEPDVGASFGLTCYTNFGNLWSSLLSAYVNVYNVEFYVAWTDLCGPVRVVGQMACYWRKPFIAAGGFEGLEGFIDDDFALGQRLRTGGLRPVQAPVVYDVNDPVESWQGYAKKFKRWIILPRHGMEPFLTRWQRFAAFLAAPATILLPSALGAVALVSRRRIPLFALAATLGTFVATNTVIHRRFLGFSLPWRRWPAVVYAALVTPVHAALMVLAGHEIEWRGQRMRLTSDGRFKRIA